MATGIWSRVCLSVLLTAAAAPSAAAPSLRAQGEEFQANVSFEGDQFQSSVASLPDGRSMVVWIDAWQGVSGRAFDAAGKPVSPEREIDRATSFFGEPHRVRVAADPVNDGFMVFWLRQSNSTSQLLARRFEAGGEPLGLPRPLYTAEPGELLLNVDAVSEGSKGFLVAWSSVTGTAFRILAQPFDLFTNPRSGAFQVNQVETQAAQPRVAVQSSGEALVTWIDGRENGNFDVWARRASDVGAVRGPEFRVELDNSGQAGGAVPVAHADGGFSVVWSDQRLTPPFWPTVSAQRFDAAGGRVGGTVELTRAVWNIQVAPAVAADPAGNLLVLWSGIELDPDGGVMGRFFSPSWQPEGDIFRVSTEREFNQTEPALAADSHGGFTATWSSGEEPYIVTPPPVEWQGQDGSSYGVFGQRLEALGPAPCDRGSEVLCLGDNGRFQVRVRWKKPDGEEGTGKAAPLTGDTGAFWFFGDANLELLIKVLDGRHVNGNRWVYYGALSDVEYTITVTDTRTGAEKTYHNPQHRLASRADVNAFPEIASVAASAAPVVSRPLSPLPATASGAAACQPSTEALCLNEGRFRVEVALVDPRDNTGKRGQAVPLTSDTGAFWFFGEENLELLIKVLDGRTVNGKFWVYYGALSDVKYTIKVTDTATGEQRTYENAPGGLISRADVEAF